MVAAVSAVLMALGTRLADLDPGLPAGWMVDGLLLGLLPRSPRITHPRILASGVAGALAVVVLTGSGHAPALLAFALAAGLLGGIARHADDFTTRRGLGVALMIIPVLAPVAPWVDALAAGSPPLAVFRLGPAWRAVVTEALGLAVIAPMVLNLVRRDLLLLLVPPSLAPTLVLAGLYAGLAAAVAMQGIAPMFLLLCPALLFLVGRLGPAGAGLGMLLTFLALAGSLALQCGQIATTGVSGRVGAVAYMQGVLLILSVTVYALGAAVAERRRMNQALADQHARLSRNESLYRLLADHASDIITRVRLDGRRLYVSPSCTDVLGWTPAEMISPDWQRHVHPADLPQFLDVRRQMAAGADYVSNVYRYARKDGGWCWLEARLHLVRRSDGSAKEFVANMRDITRQKETEMALAAAMNALAEKAATDGLTGVANRGRFDEALELEWRRATRSGEPVTLMMIDADHFKSYNDRYGHQAGDECLKAVARCIGGQIRRAHDLVARYGGEEFVAILPATPLDGGLDVGERIRAAIEAMDMPHEANADGVVTVSVGVASVVPEPGMLAADLLEAADAALYAAKRDGRNRVEASIAALRSAVVVPLLPHLRRVAPGRAETAM